MNRKELDHYLIGEAWTSTEAYANLERLCDFGSRFAGSAGGRAARDFILERFIAYGLSQARLEPFDFLAWTRGQCELRLLVVQPPTPTWGNMLQHAQSEMDYAAWTAIFPGLFIFLTVIAVNYIGDGLRDALDPRHVE